MQRFLYKIYNRSGNFVKILNDVVNTPEFTYSINGGLGEVVLELDRKVGDYGEGSDLDLNYKLEIYLNDDYNENTLIYTGYLTAFEPILKGGRESVRAIFLPNIAKLNNEFYRSGTSVKDDFNITHTDTRVGEIFKAILTNHRNLVSTMYISNDFSDIDAGNETDVITIEFKKLKHIDAIKLLEKYLGDGWFWYIDSAGKCHLKKTSDEPDHLFIFGKHITEFEGYKHIEDVINSYFIWNGEKTGNVVDNYYSDATSQAAYDAISEILIDSGIVSDSMSDIIGNAKIAKSKDPKRKVKMVISGKDYDIASIKPGDTCKILNIDANQTIFENNMVIYQILYRANGVEISLMDVDTKPILTTENKSKEAESVGGVTAEMIKDAIVKSDVGWKWEGDVLVAQFKNTNGDIGGKMYGDIIGEEPVTTLGTNCFRIMPLSNGKDGEILLFAKDGSGGLRYSTFITHNEDYVEGVDAYSFHKGDLSISSGNIYPDIEHVIWVGDSIIPMDDGVRNLGSPDYKWKNVYAESITGTFVPEGDLDMDGNKIINLGTPTNSSDAATKGYVDSAVSAYLPLSGGTMTGDIDMGGTSKITNLPTPVNNSDAATKEYVDSISVTETDPLSIHLDGSNSPTADINWGNNRITNLATPINASDAATKDYVDSADFLPLAGGTMSGNINMGANKITNLGTPVNASDAATKDYVDSAAFLPIAGGTMSGDIDMNDYDILDCGTGEITSLRTSYIWNSAGTKLFATLTGDFFQFNRYFVLASNSSDPSSPVNGLLYYNTTYDEFRIYLAGNWWRVDLTLV